MRNHLSPTRIRKSEFGIPFHPRVSFEFLVLSSPPPTPVRGRLCIIQGGWDRVRRRCLASRHDFVLKIMAACLASSRTAAASRE
jgi:hypothetical protein